ncbi:hypothetical protein [Dyella sp. AtDHG13]|uniref:hypothetical protein n=1 Tax=Dyella sp. AtDHG13 TaxID=1938897 RepID=UPI0011B3F56B|nr:hypothetical protein [Dyella sp. AtDHG13]
MGKKSMGEFGKKSVMRDKPFTTQIKFFFAPWFSRRFPRDAVRGLAYAANGSRVARASLSCPSL